MMLARIGLHTRSGHRRELTHPSGAAVPVAAANENPAREAGPAVKEMDLEAGHPAEDPARDL